MKIEWIGNKTIEYARKMGKFNYKYFFGFKDNCLCFIFKKRTGYPDLIWSNKRNYFGVTYTWYGIK